jgi:hypothetical protein
MTSPNPCSDIDRSQESTDDDTGTGQTVPPEVSVTPPGAPIFPSTDGRISAEQASRVNIMVPQQYYYTWGAPAGIRLPSYATDSNFWPGAPGINRDLVDEFRFAAGKTTIFHGYAPGLFWPELRFGRGTGIPFSIRVEPSQPAADLWDTSNEVECDFRGDYMPNSLALSHHSAESRATNPYWSNLIPLKTRVFVDTQFSSPVAFYEKETRQIDMPILDTASVTIEIPDSLILQEVQEPNNQLELSKESLYRRYGFEFLNIPKSTCIDDDKVQKYPSEQVEQIIDINSQSTDLGHRTPFLPIATDLLNLHAKISFNMHHRSKIATMFRNSRMDVLLMETIDSETPSDETFYTQIMDESISGFSGVGFPNDRVSINTRPNTYEDTLKKIYNNIHSGEQVILPRKDEYPLYYRDGFSGLLSQERNYRVHCATQEAIFNNLLNDELADKDRTFKNIIEGDNCYSEVIAYRVEKKETSTGKTLQNFYFFNSPEVPRMEFLDTQIVYGKQYTYDIYTINFVVGSEYSYVKPRFSVHMEVDSSIDEGHQDPLATNLALGFKVFNRRHLRIIEAPYYRQEIIAADRPPVYPYIEFTPEGPTVDDMFRLTFTPRMGDTTEVPVEILPSDSEVIRRMISTQNLPLDAGQPAIHYRSDSIPTHYQIIYLKEPPISIESFSDGVMIETRSEFPTVYPVVQPNQEYYMIFRTRDLAGISNPSAIYKVALYSHANGIEPYFEEYDMSSTISSQEITFDNAFSIEVSPNQATLSFARSEEEGMLPLDTAPGIEKVDLGLEPPERSVWNKKFKIRITSTTTGRQIDVNTMFLQSRITPNLRVSSIFTSNVIDQLLDPCMQKIAARASRRRDNASMSNAIAAGMNIRPSALPQRLDGAADLGNAPREMSSSGPVIENERLRELEAERREREERPRRDGLYEYD